jgi:RNA polymerase sigma-70 factor (ECF subfamily)
VNEADASRFTAIYEAHHAQVFAYAVSRAGRQLADDVVGDTFLVAWRKLVAEPDWRPRPPQNPLRPSAAEVPPSPLPWLLGVARNVIRERYRDEVRQASLAVELRAWVVDAEADIADGVTERAAMLTALAALREDDRELLTLMAWHGLSTRDAARVVGCSTATFFVRLHRARKRLQEALTAAVVAPSHQPMPFPAVEEYSR